MANLDYSLFVSPVPGAIAFTPTSPVTYGVAPINLSLSTTGDGSGNAVTYSLVSGPGTLSGANNATLTVTGVGTILVNASDYPGAAPVTATIGVNPAPLTITANNASVPFGTAYTAVGTGQTTFTASGLIGSDTIGSVTISTTETVLRRRALTPSLPARPPAALSQPATTPLLTTPARLPSYPPRHYHR